MKPVQWEYLIKWLPLDADINKFGAIGWELVCVSAQTNFNGIYFFKRQITQ